MKKTTENPGDIIPLLTEKDILKLLPISRGTWLRGVKAKRFPQPIYLGKRKFWKETDINKLLNEGITYDHQSK